MEIDLGAPQVTARRGGMPTTLQEKVAADLKASGLLMTDIGAQIMGPPERAACGLPASIDGYSIPYYSIDGARLAFYRVKCLDAEVKYKQPKNTAPHIYFPKRFKETLNGHNYVVITEGEKKAALADKVGIPCIALGGVDAWKSRTITLPKGTTLSHGKTKGEVVAKLEPEAEGDMDVQSVYASGFDQFMRMMLLDQWRHVNIVFIYDSDTPDTLTSYHVQRACASLAFEMRYLGIPLQRIRQLRIPLAAGQIDKRGKLPKLGLDDWIVQSGPQTVRKEIEGVMAERVAFPQHPNVREFINKKLGKPYLSRKDAQAVALGTLADLDINGVRMRSPTQEKMYYFDSTTKNLMRATLVRGPEMLLEEDFTRLLYKRYGLSPNDSRTLTWLATQISAEEPIENVNPHKVLFCPQREDSVKYQINDGQYISVTSKEIKLHDNSSHGIMFEGGFVDPINAKELIQEINRQLKIPLTPWWYDVLRATRMKGKKEDLVPKITALLYYMSPWLSRWRGTQLPIELITGEGGSGKSTLCEVRLRILFGNNKVNLRNAPNDLKDWHASVLNTGALHITDNLHLTDKNLRQRMSDEMCRIITAPTPYIEQRKYYTNSDLVQIPVETVFAITAIQQPFNQTDLIQRAILLEMEKKPDNEDGDIEFDSTWADDQLKSRGGRVSWVAHHIVVLHKFFQLVDLYWNSAYRAKHRLINVEQIMVIMARLFNWPSDWIPGYLSASTGKNISEADWAIEGLVAFANEWRRSHKENYKNVLFEASDIANWAETEDEFMECAQLTNARRVGRYILSNKHMVFSVAGIDVGLKRANRQTYRLIR